MGYIDDFILIPMANNHVQGYQNVIEVAHKIHPKSLLGVYPDGTIQSLEPALSIAAKT